MSYQNEDFVIEDDDSLEKSVSHSDQEISENEEEPMNLLDKIDFNVPQIVVCVGKPKEGRAMLLNGLS